MMPDDKRVVAACAFEPNSSLDRTVLRATVAVHDHGCSYQRHLDPIKSLYPRVASQQNGVE